MLSGDILGERARLTPGKTALVEVATGLRYTYAELDARARRCAALWQQTLGLEHGDRVGLLSGNRVEFLDHFFAAGKTGIVLVPLSTRLTAHELEAIVRDSGLAALAFSGECEEAVRSLRSRVGLERWVALDAPAEPSDIAYAAAPPPEAAAIRRCDPGDVYALLYTSGTTGRPKGVMVPHRMVVWNGYNTVVCWQLREDDVSPIFTPLCHAGALGAFLVPLFTIGGTIVLHRGFEPSEVWRAIEREGCTVVLGVPSIWQRLLEAPEFATADLARVRWLISGGAPLPLRLAEAYAARGVPLKQGYGLTEVGVNCFAMTVEESVRKRGAIGKPLMHTQARLVDETGRDVPLGEVGELLLRGPHVSSGYWRNPEATAAALDAAGFFHTGDLARCDPEGFYSIAGRKKDMFISGGLNVYPAEVEAELLLHPGVREAAVVGVPDDAWGEVGVAFVVAEAWSPPTPEALRGFLAERLAKYKLPTRFIYIGELPRTPYGKVRKAELSEQVPKRAGGEP